MHLLSHPFPSFFNFSIHPFFPFYTLPSLPLPYAFPFSLTFLHASLVLSYSPPSQSSLPSSTILHLFLFSSLLFLFNLSFFNHPSSIPHFLHPLQHILSRSSTIRSFPPTPSPALPFLSLTFSLPSLTLPQPSSSFPSHPPFPHVLSLPLTLLPSLPLPSILLSPSFPPQGLPTSLPGQTITRLAHHEG